MKISPIEGSQLSLRVLENSINNNINVNFIQLKLRYHRLPENSGSTYLGFKVTHTSLSPMYGFEIEVWNSHQDSNNKSIA